MLEKDVIFGLFAWRYPDYGTGFSFGVLDIRNRRKLPASRLLVTDPADFLEAVSGRPGDVCRSGMEQELLRVQEVLF
jgi:hypothetical protein